MMSTPLPSSDVPRLIIDLVAVPSLRMESLTTRRVIAAVPECSAEFRPTPATRTARDLARHIVVAELQFLAGAVSGSFPDLSEEFTHDDIDTLQRRYSERITEAIERLRMPWAVDMIGPISYRGLITMPALGFVQLAVNHSIHHRGQLSVYLRELGVPVPSIYG